MAPRARLGPTLFQEPGGSQEAKAAPAPAVLGPPVSRGTGANSPMDKLKYKSAQRCQGEQADPRAVTQPGDQEGFTKERHWIEL